MDTQSEKYYLTILGLLSAWAWQSVIEILFDRYTDNTLVTKLVYAVIITAISLFLILYIL